MNIANKLTVFRILLVPVVVAFLALENLPYRFLAAFAIFILASYTDHLDGKIARKSGLITDFGKIMDPLADKILISCIMIYLSYLRMIPVLAVVIIIAREFIVTSIRFIVIRNSDIVIPANIWGKLKTVSQIITISFSLGLSAYFEVFGYCSVLNDFIVPTRCILAWVSALLSAVSGIIYIYASREYIEIK